MQNLFIPAFPVLRVLAFGLIAIWANVAVAQSVDAVSPQISAFRAGIFCAPEVISTSPAPDTVAGVTNVLETAPPFVSAGRNMPAVLGMGFGVMSKSKNQVLLDVLIVVTHPPMGEGAVTRQSYYSEISSFGESMTLYQFDYDYELVQGPWTITASQGDTVLFQAGFNVVAPHLVPELAGICGYEELLS